MRGTGSVHPAPDNLALIVKWLHLASITGLVGGLMFAWLLPAIAMEVESGAWRRFATTMTVLWIVVLATGFTNLYLVTPKVNSAYQGLVGAKAALALAMFVVTMFLLHPISDTQRVYAKRRPFVAGLLVGALVVLLLSAYLNLSRITGSGLKPSHMDVLRITRS